MNNTIVPFSFEEFQIRTITNEQGETLFCGKDVAVALGYENPSEALKYHCKGVAKRYPLQTKGGVQEVRFITEPDMLRLIVSSQLDSAQRFERWRASRRCRELAIEPGRAQHPIYGEVNTYPIGLLDELFG